MIISDSSPLIIFAKIDRLNLLHQLFDKIILPEAVAKECTYDISKPGAILIQKEIDSGRFTIASAQSNQTFINHHNYLTNFLGKGEAHAITLAKTDNLPLLIDEKLGRKYAADLKIQIIGTCGVVLLAKRHKLVKTVKPLLLDILGHGHRLSQTLYKQTLQIAKEN